METDRMIMTRSRRRRLAWAARFDRQRDFQLARRISTSGSRCLHTHPYLPLRALFFSFFLSFLKKRGKAFILFHLFYFYFFYNECQNYVTKNKERCGRHRFVLFCHNSFDNECKRNKTRNRIVVGLSIVSVPHPPQLLNDLLIPIEKKIHIRKDSR